MKALTLAVTILGCAAASAQQTTWHFDSLTSMDGHAATLVGAPTVTLTDLGKAMHFIGHGATGDAIFLDHNPLAGALAYTFEVVFRPSSSGSPEQRFLHLQDSASASRRMFELRIHDGKWCLDSVAITDPASDPAHSAVIMNCAPSHLFPLDRWFAIAAVYDGKVLRAYVDGALQGEMPVALRPLGPGGTSVGTRFNKRDFFSGDIFSARFTPQALSPAQFLHVPPLQH